MYDRSHRGQCGARRLPAVGGDNDAHGAVGEIGPRVVAQISEETLHDEFGAREMGEGMLETCRRYFHVIEPVAIARYQAGQRGAITLTVDDFALHA